MAQLNTPNQPKIDPEKLSILMHEIEKGIVFKSVMLFLNIADTIDEYEQEIDAMILLLEQRGRNDGIAVKGGRIYPNNAIKELSCAKNKLEFFKNSYHEYIALSMQSEINTQNNANISQHTICAIGLAMVGFFGGLYLRVTRPESQYGFDFFLICCISSVIWSMSAVFLYTNNQLYNKRGLTQKKNKTLAFLGDSVE